MKIYFPSLSRREKMRLARCVRVRNGVFPSPILSLCCCCCMKNRRAFTWRAPGNGKEDGGRAGDERNEMTRADGMRLRQRTKRPKSNSGAAEITRPHRLSPPARSPPPHFLARDSRRQAPHTALFAPKEQSVPAKSVLFCPEWLHFSFKKKTFKF